MSACMSGTRGSGVLSSTGDVLVRGVGGVCDMCMCLARGGVDGEGGECIRELGLGFTNPVCGRYHKSRLSCLKLSDLDWSHITRFCEQQRQPSRGSVWPACPKNGTSGPHCWGRRGSTQFAQQLESAVTAPPLVGCGVWSLHMVASCILDQH